MSWASLTLVSDAELGYLEPEATATAAPWGATTWANARAEAKRDLKIWIESALPEVPGVADRVRDEWAPDYAFGYTGSAYTDLTTEAANAEESDVALGTILATFGTDRLYVGAAWTFDGLAVRVSSPSAVTATLTAKYWNGTAWTSLSATDGTTSGGKTLAQAGRITWTMPTAWEPRSLNGTDETFYWVELSVSAAPTSTTTASQILPVRAPDALKRIAAWLALSHIFNGLAAAAAVPEGWQAKADKYWARASELFATLRDKQGLPIDLNTSLTVDAGEQAQSAGLGRISLGRA